MDFAVPSDHFVKIKGNEKSDNYLDLARELKKAVEHEDGVISIVISALGMVLKDLKRELKVFEIRG